MSDSSYPTKKIIKDLQQTLIQTLIRGELAYTLNQDKDKAFEQTISALKKLSDVMVDMWNYGKHLDEYNSSPTSKTEEP